MNIRWLRLSMPNEEAYQIAVNQKGNLKTRVTFVCSYHSDLSNHSLSEFYSKIKPDTRFDTHCIKTGVRLWSECGDSNPGPPAPKAGALPTAQHPDISFHILRQLPQTFMRFFRFSANSGPDIAEFTAGSADFLSNRAAVSHIFSISHQSELDKCLFSGIIYLLLWANISRKVLKP